MVLKKQDTSDFLEGNDLLQEDTHFIWATMKKNYFILAIDKSRVMILPITPLGKISGEIHLLNDSDIEKQEFKKSIFGYKFIVKTFDNKLLKFVVRPFMIGYKVQTDELRAILSEKKIH